MNTEKNLVLFVYWFSVKFYEYRNKSQFYLCIGFLQNYINAEIGSVPVVYWLSAKFYEYRNKTQSYFCIGCYLVFLEF